LTGTIWVKEPCPTDAGPNPAKMTFAQSGPWTILSVKMAKNSNWLGLWRLHLFLLFFFSLRCFS
jgi:hypothetical protein